MQLGLCLEPALSVRVCGVNIFGVCELHGLIVMSKAVLNIETLANAVQTLCTALLGIPKLAALAFFTESLWQQQAVKGNVFLLRGCPSTHDVS